MQASNTKKEKEGTAPNGVDVTGQLNNSRIISLIFRSSGMIS